MYDAHLDDIVTKFEDDDVLHSQVLLHKHHIRGPLQVIPIILMISGQAVQHIPLKMLHQIHFGFQILRVFG